VREEVIVIRTIRRTLNGSHSSAPPFRASSPNSV
jgi:hypothetical protein